MSKDISTPYTYTINDLVAMYIILDLYERKKEAEKGTIIKPICRRDYENA